MYYLSPRNGYVLLEDKNELQKQERSFVLPASYKDEISHHKVMRVIESSSGKYEPESLVLVATNVVEEVEISKQKYYLVSENYIMAVVTEMENKV
jgi:co-chaperonin GroES (HSP10)